MIHGFLALGLLGIGASAAPILAKPWIATVLVFAALLAVDAILSLSRKAIQVRRRLPGRFALGAPAEVEVVLRNENRLPVRVSLFDGIPPESRTDQIPWVGELPPRQEIRVLYTIRLLRRGLLPFGPSHLQITSPFGFWTRKLIAGEPQETRVYPNFEPVLRLMLLAMEHRENQMGIIRKNLAGVSREFHQLRDYHEGDLLSQIDWKATSKRLTLVSREYEEQRDQTIIFMLDRGRRMRSMDGDLPQFDHCLNSMLLLSHVALRQGDQVGVLGFGAHTSWFPPAKGHHSMNALLNHLYDFETEPVPSDYSEAVERCLHHQRRRAFIILLTNLRSEDSRELEPALRSLRSRHLVLLASLREQEVEGRLHQSFRSLDGALGYHAAHLYAETREQVLRRLRQLGILTLDQTAQEMPVALSNRYLEIKQQGLI